ncbi:hypothetical protein DEU56DRAFT_759738, partial [Suillus clintonianus]|uniref:uncharacterized protein n=1 Tax=Suillus clintonianus TaxID=1904413 RepID=UPI001B875910
MNEMYDALASTNEVLDATLGVIMIARLIANTVAHGDLVLSGTYWCVIGNARGVALLVDVGSEAFARAKHLDTGKMEEHQDLIFDLRREVDVVIKIALREDMGEKKSRTHSYDRVRPQLLFLMGSFVGNFTLDSASFVYPTSPSSTSQSKCHTICCLERCPPICNDPVIIVADPFIAKDSEHTKRLARGALNKEERIWSLLGSFVKSKNRRIRVVCLLVSVLPSVAQHLLSTIVWRVMISISITKWTTNMMPMWDGTDSDGDPPPSGTASPAPQHEIDDIKVEYHPSSGIPTKVYHFEDYGSGPGAPPP